MLKQLLNRVRNKYQDALVDEFQDTDPVQYEIFNDLFAFASHPLFFIGDPKQSIYQFREADIFTYCKAKRFVRDSQGQRNYSLELNYRSGPRLVEAVNCVFKARDNPFLNKEISFWPSISAKQEPENRGEGETDGPFEIWFLAREEEKPLKVGRASELITGACVGEVLRLLNSQEQLTLEGQTILPQDICILVKTHKQASQMQQALIEKKVPCVLKTKDTIFQATEFRELHSLLQAVAEY